MIDIHSHILPNVDDGARTVTEALDMLRIAANSGVDTQVLTPHIHMERFENTKESIQVKFEVFREQAAAANINIRLLLGAELRIGSEIIQLALQDSIPYLGKLNGKKVFLLEFPRQQLPHASVNLITWLIENDFLPIIVHPERNKHFLEHAESLQMFMDMGCPIQITAASLSGKFGRGSQKMAEKLLISEQVTLIASDCHNLKGRSPDLLAGYTKASTIIGEAMANKLVGEFPLSFLCDNPYL